MPVGVRVGGLAAIVTLLVGWKGDREAMLAWSGVAALLCLALAGIASIAARTRVSVRHHARTFGLAAFWFAAAHLGAFCIGTDSPKPAAWLSAAMEKPFVIPGFAALAGLAAMALGAGLVSRSPRLRRIHGSLGDAVLLLTSLHLVAGTEPSALTLGAAAGCFGLAALRVRRRTSSKTPSLELPAHARRIAT